MARPRQFDEQQVLRAVVDAFWAQGYEATSTRDLVKITGLTQPSLYNAFGDKRALFRKALEFYLQNTLRERIARLESTLTPGLAITRLFAEVLERSLTDRQQRGCMLVNSSLEASYNDVELRQAIADELAQIGGFFERCLRAAQQSGEIASTQPAADGAAQLLTVLLGLRVQARVNPDPERLTAALRSTLAGLGLPPLMTDA